MALIRISFLSFFLSLFSIFCNIHGGIVASNQHLQYRFHVIEVNSLFPAITCSTSSKGSKRPQGLQVTHVHGPCSQIKEEQTNTPSTHEILLQDQARVNVIHSTISNSKNFTDSKARLPANSGLPIGTANFIVTIGFGTPKRDLPLAFDTGSSLTWIQCQPCAVQCYQQRDPIFDPSKSSSYSNISCNSIECSQLKSPLSCTSTCIYGIQYLDNSYTIGYFGRETLTLTASDIFSKFQFGCGQDNYGQFRGIAGLFGLGRKKESFISQSSQKFGEKFSYCLPPRPDKTGFLAFGNEAGVSSSTIKFTPLLTNSQRPDFYFLSLIGISVAGKRLSISPAVFSSPGTIIDSGTVITRLPPSAYSVLRSEFRESMSNYTLVPSKFFLDTCYDFTKNDTIIIPAIALHFEGGTDVEVDISGIFFATSLSNVCLAFAANNGLAIFGNTQQKTLEVVYDIRGEKIGFGSGGCSS